MSDLKFPPSEFLQEELEERQWTISDLAREMNCAEHYARALVNGGHRITRVAAMLLGEALGTGDEFWLNLQLQYDQVVEEKP
jgi:HTH-type transcriptional regulator/antitoxin HigA